MTQVVQQPVTPKPEIPTPQPSVQPGTSTPPATSPEQGKPSLIMGSYQTDALKKAAAENESSNQTPAYKS